MLPEDETNPRRNPANPPDPTDHRLYPGDPSHPYPHASTTHRLFDPADSGPAGPYPDAGLYPTGPYPHAPTRRPFPPFDSPTDGPPPSTDSYPSTGPSAGADPYPSTGAVLDPSNPSNPYPSDPEGPTNLRFPGPAAAPPDPVFKVLERMPSDYLIDADGDVAVAAATAGVAKSDFLRALGSDLALPKVAKSIHFLALMSSLELMQLAKEEIVARFTDFPDPNDDPASRRPAQSLELKSIMGVFKISADFIALSNMHQNPAAKGANRHQPPLKGAIIDASRGLRPPTQQPDPTPEQPNRPSPASRARLEQAAASFEEDLRLKLAVAPPSVRAIFERVIAEAGPNPEPNPSDPPASFDFDPNDPDLIDLDPEEESDE